MLDAVAVLDEAGIEHRILKGSAVALLDYADPSDRIFNDVDLMVRGADFDAAVAAFTATGLDRRFPEPRPGFDRRFSKGTSFLTPSGVEIDLHRTFVMGPFGLTVMLDDLWSAEAPFVVGATTLAALDDECRFLNACYHAALGNVVPRLVPQRDVAQFVLGDRIDPQRVRQLARRWKAEAVVAAAITLTWETFAIADVVALSAWAHRHEPTDRERSDIATYRDDASGYAEKSLAALRAVPGLRGKAAFLRALAFPQPSYLEGRDRGIARLRRTARAAANRRALP